MTNAASEKPGKPHRRRFLKIAVRTTLATAVGATVYAVAWEPHWIQVVRRELPIRGLPSHLIGKTLVQISDLHIGPVVDDKYITNALEQVSSLAADITVVTGDFMTYRTDAEIEQAERALRQLQPGRLATVGILGNHDYGPGWSNQGVADRLAARLRAGGIDVLRNASRDVQGLQVVGLDDLWSPCFAPEKVMTTINPAGASLVLCHNPDAADRPIWSGYRGWILCGHTHGGQCKPPFLTPPMLPVSNRRYSAGEVDLHDGRRLYINRGLGYLMRARFNARPEITVFELQPG